ncbi:MAG TPA: Plug domain-containing protein [Stellaceae bacterium]|nr:Plug domain-containing protein [Stellaceae bacterium]
MIRWIIAAVVLALLPASAAAQDPSSGEVPVNTLPTTEVVGTTPVPGVGIDRDKVPSNVQILSAPDTTKRGPAAFTNELNQRVGSVNINDNQDNPYQPDILFRGFEASPVLGTPIGVAVYQGGIRLNEPFGDNLNRDLVPDFAINRTSVIPTNSVYGLNALGGAFVLDMKTDSISRAPRERRVGCTSVSPGPTTTLWALGRPLSSWWTSIAAPSSPRRSRSKTFGRSQPRCLRQRCCPIRKYCRDNPAAALYTMSKCSRMGRDLRRRPLPQKTLSR